ncbi:hypothetical protein WEI85_17510 [Actinomycetes bacterium KLBMP 9797]
MRALTALILIFATACTASPPERPPATTGPPLRLPTVDADAPCPVTPSRPWSGAGVATAVLGDGPLYPVADYFQPGPVLRLRDDDRLPDGGYTKKVRWIGSGYTGPVLVRAARIDGAGSASVTFSYTGERRDGGYYAELRAPDSDLPATTTVSGPGCYAYQVDGTTFTTTIIFQATP